MALHVIIKYEFVEFLIINLWENIKNQKILHFIYVNCIHIKKLIYRITVEIEQEIKTGLRLALNFSQYR